MYCRYVLIVLYDLLCSWKENDNQTVKEYSQLIKHLSTWGLYQLGEFQNQFDLKHFIAFDAYVYCHQQLSNIFYYLTNEPYFMLSGYQTHRVTLSSSNSPSLGAET